jgi:hypothetical protein
MAIIGSLITFPDKSVAVRRSTAYPCGPSPLEHRNIEWV